MFYSARTNLFRVPEDAIATLRIGYIALKFDLTHRPHQVSLRSDRPGVAPDTAVGAKFIPTSLV